MPRLIVIKGTNTGQQFALAETALTVGRDSTSRIRLSDTEISRRHAEFVRGEDGAYRVRDLGSANGTFVNNQSVRDVLLQPGDHVRIGQTTLVYTLDRGEAAPPSDLADKISLITRQDHDLASNIVRTVHETEGSRIMQNPDRVAGPWQRDAQALGALYEATQLVSQTVDLEQMLERLLDLVFRTLQADRGCVLLRGGELHEGDGEPTAKDFEPRAAKWRDPARKETLPVSRTIVDHVLKERRGILVNDATRDERFQAVQSIVKSGVREVICVPMKGRHQTLGVLYLDTSTPAAALASAGRTGKFSGDSLSLAIAIAHQAALAVEGTRYFRAMVNAERLAAVGQTVAALAHDIKNILQGLMIGGSVLEGGIKDMDAATLQQGWRSVRNNHSRIHDLVTDMLSYSKDRVPDLEPVDLAALVEDIVKLLGARVVDRGVALSVACDATLPPVPADEPGIHRAVLNVVTNALDAVIGVDTPRVVISTHHEEGEPGKTGWALLRVTDNGPGVPEDMRESIFQPFVSTKGSRGTGLGLAVSRKTLREHGGDLVVRPAVGGGSVFELRLPRGAAPEAGHTLVMPPG